MELEVLRVMVGLLNEEEKVDPVRQSGESIGGERVSFIWQSGESIGGERVSFIWQSGESIGGERISFIWQSGESIGGEWVSFIWQSGKSIIGGERVSFTRSLPYLSRHGVRWWVIVMEYSSCIDRGSDSDGINLSGKIVVV